MTRPNILFLMADQFRADAMSCSGSWARTPNLDRIAAMGIRYANCITTSPICCPARVSLASGLYPHTTGLWTNKGYTMPTAWRTWMAAIRDQGYRTSLFGKTHLHRHGEDQDLRHAEGTLHAYGLDDVDETTGPHAASKTNCRMTDLWKEKGLLDPFREDIKFRNWGRGLSTHPSPLGSAYHYDTYVGEAGADYLRGYDRDQPWFCWISFAGPHEPWDAPAEYRDRFSPADMPKAKARIRSEYPRPHGGLDEHITAYDANYERISKIKRTPEHVAQMRASYAGKVALIDDRIGEILEVLEARGELDNTIIAFTSDHGEMNGDHDLVYKSCFLDGAARIPFLLSTPAMRKNGLAGSVCNAPTELIDLGPTLLGLAGGACDYEQFGVDLAPTLTDPTRWHRQSAICEFEGEVMILTEHWKAAINQAGQLYLLLDVHEPGESVNRAGDPTLKEVETELRLLILEHLARTQSQVPIVGFIE